MHGESPASPSDNRYAVSPATASQAEYRSNGTIPYAGFWRRAGAFIIDYIIVAVVLRIFALGFGGPAHQGTNPRFALIYLIAACLYYALFESSQMQATPGKRAVGLKVTDLQGEQISFGRALGRLFGHLVSYLTFGVGFAMAVFTERRQTLHDKMAGTLVVNREETSGDIAQAGAAPPIPLWQSIAVVVGVVLFNPFGIGVLAAVAIPAYQSYTIRAQIMEGLNVAAPYETAIENTVAAGTPLDSIDSSKVYVTLSDTEKYVNSVRVLRGAIDIQYGRSANKKIAGGHLVLMPGVRGTSVQWFCGHATPAADATVPIQDYEKYTNIPDSLLPMACRAGAH
jgi:uncharacterized RDD family membrane protein YckC/Tfp pilus assembly major pilin PilA